MTLLQKQEYNVWFEYLAKFAIEIRDDDGSKLLEIKDVSNILQAVSTIGRYVNALEVENLIITKRESLTRGSYLDLQAKSKSKIL
jgi:ABC-type glucose/galactose transport system permease subunit